MKISRSRIQGNRAGVNRKGTPQPPASPRETFSPSGGRAESVCYGPFLCKPSLPTAGLRQSEIENLLVWTEEEAIGQLDFEQAEARIAATAKLFKKRGDRRGIFPSGYLAMTKETREFIRELPQEKALKARQLATDFAKRYFQGLGDHLRGKPNQAWDGYYLEASRPDSDPVQIFLSGATAHLVNDLPQSVAVAGLRGGEDKELFLKWGERLSASTPGLVRALADDHGIDARAFQVSRHGRALIFGAMRESAWSNSQAFFRDREAIGTESALEKLQKNSHTAHLRVEALRRVFQPAVSLGGWLGAIGLRM